MTEMDVLEQVEQVLETELQEFAEWNHTMLHNITVYAAQQAMQRQRKNLYLPAQISAIADVPDEDLVVRVRIEFGKGSLE